MDIQIIIESKSIAIIYEFMCLAISSQIFEEVNPRSAKPWWDFIGGLLSNAGHWTQCIGTPIPYTVLIRPVPCIDRPIYNKNCRTSPFDSRSDF